MHHLLASGLTQKELFDATGMRRPHQLTELRVAQYD